MREPQQLTKSRIRFLGEQNGDPEILLKSRLAELFSTSQKVSRAYLVRVDFGWLSKKSVILAVRGMMADLELVEEVGRIFANLFNTKEHLDILFLTDDQEEEITRVAKPFFNRA